MAPETVTILAGIALIAAIAMVLYFRSDTGGTKDTYQVALNDVYFRRLFVPLAISVLILAGVFLIIRGSPGIEYSIPTIPKF